MKLGGRKQGAERYTIRTAGENLITLTIHEHMRFTIDDVRKFYRWIEALEAPKGLRLEVHQSHYLFLEQEARRLLLRHPLINKCAMLTDDTLLRWSGNVRFYVHAPSFPVRYFASRAKAKAWLDYC